MKHPDYTPAAERGTVRGQLHVTDPQDAPASPENAWVGLAAPEPDWQKQSNGYRFWIHADKQGRFTIPNVRPGDYTLYAFAHNAKITVFVNDQPVDRLGTGLDNAMIRAGIHGQYSEQDVTFDAALLKPGTNAISLEQSAGGNVQKSVMYDCVRLELDDSQPFDKTKVPPRKHAAKPVGGESGDSAD